LGEQTYDWLVLQTLSRGAELAQQLIANQHQIDLMLLEQSRLAAEFVQTPYADEEGSATPYDWIRINCHLTSNQVSDRVAVGELMGRLAESTQAVRSREIGFCHLVVMARTAAAVGKAFDESHLLALARKHSAGKFRFRCDQYRHACDPDAYAAEQRRNYEQRHLRLSRWEDGSLILNGVLDPVEGAAFRSAIEPLARRSGAHDDRTREQRLADALVELVTHRQQVHMQVTASVETLLGLLGSPGAENEFALPISSRTVERWACDSSLTRILMQDSVVVDVGRAERTIRGPRRRALEARDQHCRWPGCDRPASWCDGHHVVHWLHGGGGEIENQVLLCGRHHSLVHEGGWQLIKQADGEIVPVAPTVTFGLARGPN
jgi:hypothetical protein